MTDLTMKPLLVSQPVARQLLGVGVTKFWELSKKGDVETVVVGGRRMVRYESLERLAAPKQATP